jgi:hypothetical protein
VTIKSRVIAVGLILFCFEIGFFLVFVPWSVLWENNLLFTYAPRLQAFLLSTIVRSGVTALGLLNFLIGISEIRRFVRSFAD